MTLLRALLFRHRACAMLMVFAAICMKIIVPTGFMIGLNSKVLTIQICEDATGNHAVMQVVIPMKGGSDQSGAAQGKADCPFASLSAAGLTGTDPALLVVALAFILAVGFASTALPPIKRVFYLQPPLRGPPALV